MSTAADDGPQLADLFAAAPSQADRASSQRAGIELRLVCISLVFIACVCAGGLLVFLEPVLKPLVFAIFLSYLLSPAVEWLTTPFSPQALRLRLVGFVRSGHKPLGVHDDEEEEAVIGSPTDGFRPRAGSRSRGGPSAFLPGTVAVPHSLAVVVVLGLTAMLIVVFLDLVVLSLASLEEKFPKYRAQAVELISLARSAFGRGTALSRALENVQRSFGGNLELSQVPSAWLSRWIAQIPITSFLMQIAGTVLSALETTAIVLLYSVFLMMGGSAPRAPRAGGFRLATPPSDRAAAADAAGESGGVGACAEPSLGEKIDAQVRRYIVLKSALSLLVALGVGATLSLLAVDLAFLFGIVSFFANFVPNVGAVVATLLPLPVALLDPGLSWMACLLTLLVPLAIHLLVGSVLEPKLLGLGLALHPVVVLFTALLWALLWGVGGMIVSVPLTAVLRISLLEVQHPWAARCVGILEGRWMHGFHAAQGGVPAARNRHERAGAAAEGPAA